LTVLTNVLSHDILSTVYANTDKWAGKNSETPLKIKIKSTLLEYAICTSVRKRFYLL